MGGHAPFSPLRNNERVCSGICNCVEAFDVATQFRMRYLGVTHIDLLAGKIKDSRIGTWLNSIHKIEAVFLNKKVRNTHPIHAL